VTTVVVDCAVSVEEFIDIIIILKSIVLYQITSNIVSHFKNYHLILTVLDVLVDHRQEITCAGKV